MSIEPNPPVDENTGIISVPGIIAIIGAVVGAIGSLAASAVLVIGALNETTEAVERAATVAVNASQTQDKKLDEIHQQTNSNLTELKAQLKIAMAELAGAREDLALMAGRQEGKNEAETTGEDGE